MVILEDYLIIGEEEGKFEAVLINFNEELG